MEKVPSDLRKKAQRYIELQFKKSQGELSPDEQQDMDKIIQEASLTHEELISLATNEVVAQQ